MEHKHILAVNQFTKSDLDEIFGLTDQIQSYFEGKEGYIDPRFTTPVSDQSVDGLSWKKPYDFMLATCFHEASTRTRFSFEAAHQRLGGTLLSVADMAGTSSQSKGETLADTVKTVSQFADAICLRHPQKDWHNGVIEASDVPIINCGDGSNEHPTQALLDLYTIWREKKTIDGLNILFFGDTRFARTIRSLKTLLNLYDVETTNELIFHSEAEPGDQSWEQKLRQCDVLYITRPQKERWPSPDAYRLKNIVFSFAELSKMKEDAIVLHPGPRTAEMNPQADRDERVAIWRQVKNGMYLRMALLKLLLSHT